MEMDDLGVHLFLETPVFFFKWRIVGDKFHPTTISNFHRGERLETL